MYQELSVNNKIFDILLYQFWILLYLCIENKINNEHYDTFKQIFHSRSEQSAAPAAEPESESGSAVGLLWNSTSRMNTEKEDKHKRNTNDTNTK